jgi:hypothetical protein
MTTLSEMIRTEVREIHKEENGYECHCDAVTAALGRIGKAGVGQKGIKMNHKKEILEFLSTKLIEKTSRLQMLWIVENGGTDEQKKALEANDIMAALLGGKPFPKKDTSFIERNATLYEEIRLLAADVNAITASEELGKAWLKE